MFYFTCDGGALWWTNKSLMSYTIIGFYLLDVEEREALMNLGNIDYLYPTIQPEDAIVDIETVVNKFD